MAYLDNDQDHEDEEEEEYDDEDYQEDWEDWCGIVVLLLILEAFRIL